MFKEGKKTLFTHEPAMPDINGYLYSSVEINTLMRNLLEDLLEKSFNLFLPTIKSSDDINER